MSQKKPTIFVTGGAGYVGSHTCKALAHAGYTPVVYDNLSRGTSSAVKWGPLEVGDISDRETLRDALRRHRPDGVIHFAAYAYVGESMNDPLLYYRNNVSATITLLSVMASEAITRLVFSSTCATYGIPAKNPIREDMPQAPVNPYGQSKLMVEQILRDWARLGSLSAVALRYFNAAGADADSEIGEAHEPETHLIPLALAAAKGTAPPLTIFGKDHETRDGTCIRDYIHVSDLADAHVRAMAWTRGNVGFTSLNLGTGEGVSVKDVIAEVRRITGRAVPFSNGPRRDGDPPALVADPTEAFNVLGWRAQHSDLHTILSTAWRWMERQA